MVVVIKGQCLPPAMVPRRRGSATIGMAIATEAGAAAPVVALVRRLEMQPLVRGDAGRTPRHRQRRAIELQRVRHVHAHADRKTVLVALHDRVDRLLAKAAREPVRAGVLRHRVERNVSGRPHDPLPDDRVLRGEPLAEKRDRPHVVERAGFDARRHEALAGIAERPAATDSPIG